MFSKFYVVGTQVPYPRITPPTGRHCGDISGLLLSSRPVRAPVVPSYFLFLFRALFSPGGSVWTGSFYVLREDGSLSSYASKDIQGQTPVKVIATMSFVFCVLCYVRN